MSYNQIKKEIGAINKELLNLENKLNSEVSEIIKDQLVEKKISLLNEKVKQIQILIQYQNDASNQIKNEIEKNNLLLLNKYMYDISLRKPIKRITCEINNNINTHENNSHDIKILKK